MQTTQINYANIVPDATNIVSDANIPPQELIERFDELALQHDAISNLYKLAASQNLNLQQSLEKSRQTDKNFVETIQKAFEAESKKNGLLEAEIVMLKNH